MACILLILGSGAVSHVILKIMVVTLSIQHCTYCESRNIKKNGKASNGKQQFVCKDCKRSFRENPSHNGYTPEAKEQTLRAYQERSSLRGLTRIFGVSRNTVTSWIKKMFK
jgi:transposase-like protein